MPKNKKESFAEMFKALKQNKVEGAKPVEKILERKYFLIVTEGKRTEPNYFNYFKKYLPNHFVETIDVQGKGDNTINIVKKAIELRDERLNSFTVPKYDEVWAVFDKDEFSDKNFNGAVALAEQNNINSGHSNESFELWYVLHFQFLQNALGRERYIEILTNELGFKYEKEELKIMPFLFNKKKMLQAIKWAKQLEENAKGLTPSQACPTTKVYALVEKLMEFVKFE